MPDYILLKSLRGGCNIHNNPKLDASLLIRIQNTTNLKLRRHARGLMKNNSLSSRIPYDGPLTPNPSPSFYSDFFSGQCVLLKGIVYSKPGFCNRHSITSNKMVFLVLLIIEKFSKLFNEPRDIIPKKPSKPYCYYIVLISRTWVERVYRFFVFFVFFRIN